jgi:hypothetical protein
MVLSVVRAAHHRGRAGDVGEEEAPAVVGGGEALAGDPQVLDVEAREPLHPQAGHLAHRGRVGGELHLEIVQRAGRGVELEAVHELGNGSRVTCAVDHHAPHRQIACA